MRGCAQGPGPREFSVKFSYLMATWRQYCMERSLFFSACVCFSSAFGFVVCVFLFVPSHYSVMALLISLSYGVVKPTNLKCHYNCCLPSIQLIKICKSTTWHLWFSKEHTLFGWQVSRNLFLLPPSFLGVRFPSLQIFKI